MSMRHYTEDGYGIPFNSHHNKEKIIRFLYDHGQLPPGETPDSLLEAMSEDPYLSMWEFFSECPSDMVARVINKIEGTTIFRGYWECGDTDQEEMIGVEPCYPWTMNEKDRSLTKEDATAILIKYAEILGIEDAPEYFEAYYVG